MHTTQTRAQPLSPDERKRAILDAVIPLIVEGGSSVTTADMAAAANVAEGTIYSVFPDKATLIAEAVKVAVDADPVRSQILAIDEAWSFEDQLAEIATILTNRFAKVVALFNVLRTMRAAPIGASENAREHVTASNTEVSKAIEALLDRQRHQLRIEPRQAAAALSGLIFATSYPLVEKERRLSIEALVDILLHGVIRDAS